MAIPNARARRWIRSDRRRAGQATSSMRRGSGVNIARNRTASNGRTRHDTRRYRASGSNSSFWARFFRALSMGYFNR